MRVKVSDYIAGRLVEAGISQVFTVTGGGAMHLNDALGHQKGLHCLYNHHEQKAMPGFTIILLQSALLPDQVAPMPLLE